MDSQHRSRISLRQKVGHSTVTERKDERVGIDVCKFIDLIIGM